MEYEGCLLYTSSCAVCCNDSNGQIIASPASFDNDLAGAVSLVAFLVDLAAKQSAAGLKIGLEATSVYGVPVSYTHLDVYKRQGQEYIY